VIFSLVVLGAQELREQVTMSSVKLHAVKTGFLAALCRSNKIVDQRLHLIVTHRFRAGFFIVGWTLRHPAQ